MWSGGSHDGGVTLSQGGSTPQPHTSHGSVIIPCLGQSRLQCGTLLSIAIECLGHDSNCNCNALVMIVIVMVMHGSN